MDKSDVAAFKKSFSRRPLWWFGSQLSLYMEKAQCNIVHSFVTRAETKSLKLFNKLFLILRDCEPHAEAEAAYPFFIRAYSSWLSAVRAWASGQVTETYILLRASLECVLYGNTLSLHDSELFYKDLYVDRKDQNGRIKDDFQRRFGIKKMISELPELKELMSQLYEASIELGAHPNLFGVFHSRKEIGANKETYGYLGADDKDMDIACRCLFGSALIALTTYEKLLLTSTESAEFNKKLHSVVSDLGL